MSGGDKDVVTAWLTEHCGAGLPYADATDLPSALHGAAYAMRQIATCSGYRPHIGQSGPAWTAIKFLLEYVARAEMAKAAPPWQPIKTARKNRSVIWAAFHPRIYPDLEPQRPDLETWNGVQIALRHPGVVQYDDGPFDQGWGVAAPVGCGGFPDRWIVGWLPLPAAPEVRS